MRRLTLGKRLNGPTGSRGGEAACAVERGSIAVILARESDDRRDLAERESHESNRRQECEIAPRDVVDLAARHLDSERLKRPPIQRIANRLHGRFASFGLAIAARKPAALTHDAKSTGSRYARRIQSCWTSPGR